MGHDADPVDVKKEVGLQLIRGELPELPERRVSGIGQRQRNTPLFAVKRLLLRHDADIAGIGRTRYAQVFCKLTGHEEELIAVDQVTAEHLLGLVLQRIKVG